MANAPRNEEVVEEKKRGPMLAIIAGIIAGLLAGGVAVFFVTQDGESVQPPADGAEQEQKVEKQKPVTDLLVVRRRRLAIPLINADDKPLGYIWVDLAFEVDGPDNQSLVSARLPALTDAYLRDLHNRQTTRDDRPGALDFDLLHGRLRELTDEILGNGVVLEIRITNAMRVPG